MATPSQRELFHVKHQRRIEMLYHPRNNSSEGPRRWLLRSAGGPFGNAIKSDHIRALPAVRAHHPLYRHSLDVYRTPRCPCISGPRSTPRIHFTNGNRQSERRIKVRRRPPGRNSASCVTGSRPFPLGDAEDCRLVGDIRYESPLAPPSPKSAHTLVCG